jgi:hypothetical protein
MKNYLVRIALCVFGFLLAMPHGTIQCGRNINALHKADKSTWEMAQEELKHIGETALAIATGFFGCAAYNLTSCFLYKQLFDIDFTKDVYRSLTTAPFSHFVALACITAVSLYSFYLTQKVVKLGLHAVGRKYNGSKFDFLMYATACAIVALSCLKK